MKIGIIYYPWASFVDIAALLSTFKECKSLAEIQFEICSYLPFTDKGDTLSVTASHVGLPLNGFDLLVIPGSEINENGDLDINWITWLRATDSDTVYYAFNQGKSLLKPMKLENKWKQSEINPLNGYFTGLTILKEVLSPDEILEISKKLGIESFWQSFFQSQNLRQASISRKTAETQISIKLDLDGNGKSTITTAIPFLDHMINQISKHGLFDIELKAVGK